MILITPPMRNDSMGEGHFGASRGSRTHNGVDLCAHPGSLIRAPVTGKVTRLGYPYGDSRPGGAQTECPYRYVEITDSNRERHRVFYVSPEVELHDWVLQDRTIIGTAQDLSERHGAAMINHIHYEVKRPDNTYRAPQ